MHQDECGRELTGAIASRNSINHDKDLLTADVSQGNHEYLNLRNAVNFSHGNCETVISAERRRGFCRGNRGTRP